MDTDTARKADLQALRMLLVTALAKADALDLIVAAHVATALDRLDSCAQTTC